MKIGDLVKYKRSVSRNLRISAHSVGIIIKDKQKWLSSQSKAHGFKIVWFPELIETNQGRLYLEVINETR